MIVLAIMSLAVQLRAAQVYLDAPAPYSDSNPQWKVWAWANGQQGYWVQGTVLSNGLIEFTVNEDNLQFVRFSTDGNTEWNRTVNLSTVDDATYTITGWGSGSGMTANVTPCVRVYLDPSAVTESGNVWYAWSFPTNGNGSWVAPFSQSGNIYEFRVPQNNDKVIFVRMNPNGAPSWDYNNGIALNQTNDLSVVVGDTYVITSLGTDKMVGYWASMAPVQKTLAQLAADEYYLPDEWVINDLSLDGEFVVVDFIETQDLLILRSTGTNDADYKWYQDENDTFFQNLKTNGYNFHVYKKGSLYGQNNWVSLKITDLTISQLDFVRGLVNSTISNIEGKLNVSNSFDICMELTYNQLNNCTITSSDEEIEVNTYSVPFFNLHDQGRIYNDNMRNPYDATYSGDVDYLQEGPQFLPLAKPNEICTLQWAVLKFDENNHRYYFETPDKEIVTDQETGDLDVTHSSNLFNLQGKVNINFTYCEGYNPSNPETVIGEQLVGEKDDNSGKPFKLGMMYTVKGLVKTVAHTVKSPQWAPRRVNSAPDQYFGVETKDWDIEYEFYPLEEPSYEEDPADPTGVTDVVIDRKVIGVTYYNLAGLSSRKPFGGINIVRTTYSDGTSSVTKQLIK